MTLSRGGSIDAFETNLDGYYDVENQLLPALADRNVEWVGVDPERFR